jgi:hypothetical protein
MAALPGAGLKYINNLVGELDEAQVDREAMQLASKIPDLLAKVAAAVVKAVVPGAGQVTELAGHVPGASNVPGLG